MNRSTSSVLNFSHGSRIARPLAAVVLATALSSATVAKANGTVGEAAPFVNRSEMLMWLADGERGLWIQARNLRWVYARFSGICHGVSATNSLVFETGESGKIGRHSSILLPGHLRCAVQTLTRSEGPPMDRNVAVELQPQTQ